MRKELLIDFELRPIVVEVHSAVEHHCWFAEPAVDTGEHFNVVFCPSNTTLAGTTTPAIGQVEWNAMIEFAKLPPRRLQPHRPRSRGYRGGALVLRPSLQVRAARQERLHGFHRSGRTGATGQ